MITLSDWMRAITLAESIERVETDLAATLRALADPAAGTTAARRLRLADEADRGARAAAKTKERLRSDARRWADNADRLALWRAVDHATRLLTELADAENDIASLLIRVAGRHGSQGPVRHLAAGASVAARRDQDRVRSLRQLAGTQAITEGSLQRARREAGPRDRPEPPAGASSARTGHDAEGHVPEAGHDRPRTPADVRRAAQAAQAALYSAARAHDRAAEAEERSARAGIGDVAEHERRAAFHRAAAAADRQRYEEAHGEPGEAELSGQRS